jgi:type IV secretion system protein VirB8
MNRTDFKAYLEESRGLERDFLAELVRSRRIAWRIAGVACAVLALALVGFLFLLPLKRVEPFVVRVDNATGGVDIVTMLTDAPAAYGEVVNKYWLNRYVLCRESYDYQTIQETYDTTVLLSAASVQREFRTLFDGPQARDKVFGDRLRFVVRVLSITPAKDTAVVRFVRTRRTDDPSQDQEEHLVATLGFQFVAAPMKETDRLVNPLGFQVTSYRVDPETVGG